MSGTLCCCEHRGVPSPSPRMVGLAEDSCRNAAVHHRPLRAQRRLSAKPRKRRRPLGAVAPRKQEKRSPGWVLLAWLHSSAICYREVAMDRWSSSTEVREADRSHASGPPSSSEHMNVRTARPDEEAIAPIPRDRRATALTVTSLHKPQFSQGHVGATAVGKDRPPRPTPELRN
jgi:hypothetical protein